MDASIRHSIPPLPYAQDDLLVERRRPNRAEADPALLPLLREAGHSKFTDFETESCPDGFEGRSAMDRDHDGNVVKGIVVALMLSMPFWLVTALIGVMILR